MHSKDVPPERAGEVCRAQLEAVMENVNEAVVVCDAGGRVVQMNRPALEMWGWTSVEQAWQSLSDFADRFELCTPEGAAIPQADWPLSRAVRGETVDKCAVLIHDKRTGGEWLADCRGGPVRDRRGEILFAVLTLRTFDRPMEEALQERDFKLTSLCQAVPVGIGLASNRILLDVNDQLCAMSGYRREELIGRNSRILYPTQEDWEYVGGEKLRQIGERGAVVVESRWRRKDGEVIDVLLSSTPLDPGDLSKGITFTALDITDRKRAEDELRNIFDFSLDMICIGDIRTGAFVKVNPAFERTLGYSEQELLGHPVMDFVHPDDADRTRAIIQDKLSRGEHVFYFENRFRCQDGSYRWLNWTAHPLVEQGLTYAVARDVTEQKRMEEALRFTQFAIDHTADAAFWMTADGRFCYVNEAACRALGYSHDELMCMSVYDIDPEFTETRWVEAWRQLKTRRNLVFQTTHKAKNGRIYPVEIRANYVEFGGREYDCAFARDITARKRTEQALRRSEERYRFLVESINDWIWEVDEHGVYTYASPQCREVLGYEPQEIVGKTPFDLMPPEEARRVGEIFGSIAGQAKSFRRLENVNRRKDGHLVVLETNGNPILDAQGKLAGYRGVDRDITDRKQAEEALRESEERYRLLLDRGFDGIFVHENFKVVQLNDRFAEMIGYTRPELLGSSAIGLFTPDSQERIRQYIRAGASGYYDVQLRHRDGHLVRVESFGAPCKFQGRGARIVGLRDITERKQAEEALREKEYLLSESQRMGHIGTWSVDLATDVATWTRETYRLFGVSPETFVPTEGAMLNLLHPDDRAAMEEWIRAALTGEHPDALEFRVTFPDGSTRVLSGRGELILDDHDQPRRLVGTAQDITEQKRTEESLHRLNENLEQLVAERTEDLSNTVARLQQLTWELSQAEDRERKRIADLLHDDVQQTLAAARFHLNLLSMESRSVEESQEIIEQVKGMLKEAIEKARSLSHELSPALYQVGLPDILNWLAGHMKRTHGLSVRVEARGQVDSHSEALKALLYKVTQELLFNVVKHAGVKQARIRVRRLGRYIGMEVIDDGKGFDPQAFEGMAGFGLLSIRERVGLLGGRVKVRSLPGRGTRVLVVVPDEGPAGAAREVR